jgi:4-hydroxybenzoate polyprenyltransferase
VDGHVKRTADRPLASGKVSHAKRWCCSPAGRGEFPAGAVHQRRTVWLSFGAVALAFCYPFMKRYTYYPQVVLGAAYSWGMPMAFTAAGGELPAAPGCCTSPTCCGRWATTPTTPWSTATTT